MYTYLDRKGKTLKIGDKVRAKIRLSGGDHPLMASYPEIEGAIDKMDGATVYIKGTPLKTSYRVIGTGEYVHDQPIDRHLAGTHWDATRKAVVCTDRHTFDDGPYAQVNETWVEKI